MLDRKQIKLFKSVSLAGERSDKMREIWNKISAEFGSGGGESESDGQCKTSARRVRWSGGRIAAVSAAAILAVCLVTAVCLASFTGRKFTTGADRMALTLPDSSKVTLYEFSTLKYNRFGWLFSRRVNLEGKAEFQVTHGGRFRTVTPEGVVSVLGTKFIVSGGAGILHVECSEGRVRVETDAGEAVLNKGEQLDADANCLRKSAIVVETAEEAPVETEVKKAPVRRRPAKTIAEEAETVKKDSSRTFVAMISLDGIGGGDTLSGGEEEDEIWRDPSQGLRIKSDPVAIPSFAVKTNLLYAAVTTLNVGFEVGLTPKTSLDIQAGYNGWARFNGTRFNYLTVQREYRYWTSGRFSGSFFGLTAHYGAASTGLRTAGLGVGYGYHLILDKRWGIEFEAGLGCTAVSYDSGSILDNPEFHFVPTRLGVNIVYVW